jgi:hypothetical protein
MPEWMPEGPFLLVAVIGIVIIAVGLLQLVRSGTMSWALLGLMALGVAMAGASVFTEISAGRDGVRIITVAQATNAVAEKVGANASAIAEISEALADLHTMVAALAPSGRVGGALAPLRQRPEDLRQLSDAQDRLENLTARTDALAAASRANVAELEQQIERLNAITEQRR